MFLPQKMLDADEVLELFEPSLPKDVTVILSDSQKTALQRCCGGCNVLFIRQPNLKDLSLLFDAQLAGRLLFLSVDIEPLHNWGPRLLWLKSSGGVYFFIRLQNTGHCADWNCCSLIDKMGGITFFFLLRPWSMTFDPSHKSKSLLELHPVRSGQCLHP